MSRELIERLIKKKKALYTEQHQLDLQKLAIDEKFLFADDEEKIEKQVLLLELDTKQLNVQLTLNRAHSFGLNFAKSLVPSICITCFIEHNQSSPMNEIESKLGNGIRQFKCVKCGDELSVAPPIGNP